MTTKHRPRFDIAALRELAGDKVFARGEVYHRDGQVDLLSIDAKRVLAQVAGTEDYRTVLAGRGKKIDGECSCRAFEDWGWYCRALLERALDLHLVAAGSVRPDPVALARDLFAREMEEGYDTFYRAAQAYSKVLGKKGLAEYRRLATEAWAKLPPRSGKGRATSEVLGDYDRLKDMLDGFAEGDGDVEARIALRTKDLSSPWKYLELAEFCRAQGRDAEALRHAEEGLWVFEDQAPEERLVLLAADLLAKAGRKSDAEARLWQAFEKEPSLELYTRLRKLGGKAACERAIGFLEASLAKKTPTRWHGDGDLLIDILMQEKLFDAAWASVRRHGASVKMKETLARASEATHPREAVEVYAERVAQLAAVGGTQAYAEAKKLIGGMAGLRSAAEHRAYLLELKTRFGRKRNFMKLLD